MCQKMNLNVIQTQQIVKENKNTVRVDFLFDEEVQVMFNKI